MDGVKKRMKMPHTYVILFSIVILAAIASYTLPAGVYDRSKDRNIFFNPAKVEACVIEWTGKKDYSQDIHTFHVYLESGHTLNGEVNDDGKTKILNAINSV